MGYKITIEGTKYGMGEGIEIDGTEYYVGWECCDCNQPTLVLVDSNQYMRTKHRKESGHRTKTILIEA